MTFNKDEITEQIITYMESKRVKRDYKKELKEFLAKYSK